MTDEEELRKKLLIIDKIKTETRFYHNLWESLTYAELLSLRKSNRFSRNLARQFKFYLPTRIIKDMIPVIALVSLAAYVMNSARGKETKQLGARA